LIFVATSIPGAFVVHLERHEDERGFFARAWSPEDLQANGLDPRLAQTSLSWNQRRGTLRGMHYQMAPFEEAKLVTCVRGALHDVIVDLRAGSPGFRKWFGVRLDAERLDALYVPGGVAHGYLTLADDTLVHYQISERYSPEYARGVRWDDPAIGIEWPVRPVAISERDAAFPLLEPVRS
jgi:dTDP-4-dehydrorhamnose 3,5-epimerase